MNDKSVTAKSKLIDIFGELPDSATMSQLMELACPTGEAVYEGTIRMTVNGKPFDLHAEICDECGGWVRLLRKPARSISLVR